MTTARLVLPKPPAGMFFLGEEATTTAVALARTGPAVWGSVAAAAIGRDGCIGLTGLVDASLSFMP